MKSSANAAYDIPDYEQPADPSAKLVWINGLHGVQTCEVVSVEYVGRKIARFKLRPRFQIASKDGKRFRKRIVAGRLETVEANRVFPTLNCVKSAVTKALRQEIADCERRLGQVLKFQPGKVA